MIICIIKGKLERGKIMNTLKSKNRPGFCSPRIAVLVAFSAIMLAVGFMLLRAGVYSVDKHTSVNTTRINTMANGN